MNIESFTPEVVSHASARRVSERKKIITLVDKTFFKKTYKAKKEKVSSDTNNKTTSVELSPCKEVDYFDTAAKSLFPVLQANRLQSKAIQAYRVKKLKQMFSDKASLEEAISRHKALGLNMYLLQYFRRAAPNGKSLYASKRARNEMGRFQHEMEFSKPHSSQYSTVDMREDCRTESMTTAGGSLLSLLSLDKPEGTSCNQSQLIFDFDSLFEASRRDSKAFGPAENSEPSTTYQTPVALPPSKLSSALPGGSSCEKPLCWKAEEVEERSPFAHDLLSFMNEDLDEDTVSMDDFFGTD